MECKAKDQLQSLTGISWVLMQSIISEAQYPLRGQRSLWPRRPLPQSFFDDAFDASISFLLSPRNDIFWHGESVLELIGTSSI